MMILHKKIPYEVLEILRYFCTTKCLKKYQRLQFLCLYVPILDETPCLVTKLKVQTLKERIRSPLAAYDPSGLKIRRSLGLLHKSWLDFLSLPDLRYQRYFKDFQILTLEIVSVDPVENVETSV